MFGLAENKDARDKKLKAAQAKQKLRDVEVANQKEVRIYKQDLKKSGIPEVNRLLDEISEITAMQEDIPGQGMGAFLPQKGLSESGKSLREKIHKLFNMDLFVDAYF